MRPRRRAIPQATTALLILTVAGCPAPDEKRDAPTVATPSPSEAPTPTDPAKASDASDPREAPAVAPEAPVPAGSSAVDPSAGSAQPPEETADPGANSDGSGPSEPAKLAASAPAIAQGILSAARAKDFDALGKLMEGEFYFEGPMGDRPMTRKAALKYWRSEPARLDRLVALLEGPCAGTGSTWECPSSVIEVEEYGNAERLSISRVDDQWRWNVFISD